MICKLLSSLEKVFSDGRGTDAPAPALAALRGESLSFQIALKNEDPTLSYAWPQVQCELAAPLRLRRVESVPVRIPRAPETADEHYLSLEPGLYPDLLTELKGGPVLLPAGQWRALHVELEIPRDAAAGEYGFAFCLKNAAGEAIAQADARIRVLPALLPPQTIRHTEWFHADCLADYYRVPAFSQRHWEIIEEFVKTAAKRGCTMLLTPHFTPPLDTWIGGERTTVQLVDVTVERGQYSFDFSRLKRWIDMALRCGMEWIEFAHLFTQWGAKAAPKVMAMKDGQYTRIFGWDTPSVGGEYTAFLHAYLPRLIEKLREWGVDKRCYFHISDEPSPEQLESYAAARASVRELLDGFPIMDAMSHYEIYQQSGISTPVVSVGRIENFMEKRVDPLWGYYCCGPTKVTTNRFLMMSLARTRAIGLQIWKYGWQGFLHWGYNFYNTVHSVAHVNPYLDTEAGGRFPPGDSFLVYPGPDGKPEESLRLMALHEAMQDVRALQLLESLIGREGALAVLDSQGEITLESYPQDGPAFLRLRSAILDAIAAAC